MASTIKELLKYTFTSAACLLSLAVFFFIFKFDLLTSLVLTFFLGAFLYYRDPRKTRISRGTSSRAQQTAPLKKASPEKEAFYHSRGLTKDEMNVFRNTMQSAREEIYAVEANANSRSKMKAIFSRQNTLPILKDFFKRIVEQPERLPEVDKFLYTHLPNLKELTDHYIQIDDHVAKTKATYESLAKCADTIDEMCNLIKEDYTSFLENDLDNLDIELELANHVLKRDNEGRSGSDPFEEEL